MGGLVRGGGNWGGLQMALGHPAQIATPKINRRGRVCHAPVRLAVSIVPARNVVPLKLFGPSGVLPGSATSLA